MHVTIKATVLGLVSMGLLACGQKGALILPSDHHAKDSKAVYIIKPRKASGEVDPAAQRSISAQPASEHPASIN